jgi:hypothetical protein
MFQSTRTNFFMVMALLLLVLVFLGFAPTLYLRPFFGAVDQGTRSPQLPLHLVLHGLAMSSWYLLFALQAVLVRYQRVALHRQLGWAGVASACAVVVSGFVVLSRAVPRRVESGVLPPEIPPEIIEGGSGVLLFQTWNLSCFAVCVLLAIWFRKRSWLHKRLLLIASIQVLTAALSTGRSFGAAMESVIPHSTLGLNVLLALALPVFDYLSAKKVYAVSLIGAALIIAPFVLLPVLIGTPAATAWVRWLGNVP